MVVWIALAGGAAAAAAGGCGSTLETGYEPRRLGAGPAERRGFYSPRFSPEAQAARQERQEGAIDRRPGVGPDAGP